MIILLVRDFENTDLMFFEFGEAYSALENKQLIWTMVSFYTLEREI